jgi:hypothetical protein
MRQFLILFFLVALSDSKAQSICNGSFPVDYIYYPNSTSTQTNTGTTHCSYLCGPNTTLIDTNSYGCRQFYVNANCTLTFKTPLCGVNSIIWVKNNGVINLVSGGPVNLEIYFEPLAVINNTASVSYFSGPCPSITFPAVSCATGISEYNENITTNIYPNPTSTTLFIDINNSTDKVFNLKIFNLYNQIYVDRNNWSQVEKEISVDNLPAGVYFLEITSGLHRQTKIITINR